jgi:hypothetical protein
MKRTKLNVCRICVIVISAALTLPGQAVADPTGGSGLPKVGAMQLAPVPAQPGAAVSSGLANTGSTPR